MNLIAKPLKDIVVKANRDACLSRRCLDDSTSLAMLEFVLFLHLLLSCRRRSDAVADRAEINLTVSPRHV
jgi:hypothetical protein